MTAHSDLPHGTAPAAAPLTPYPFGDSILDCADYDVQGVHPGQLPVRNDDALFSDVAGRDLQASGPSPAGASEVRRAFLAPLLAALGIAAD